MYSARLRGSTNWYEITVKKQSSVEIRHHVRRKVELYFLQNAKSIVLRKGHEIHMSDVQPH